MTQDQFGGAPDDLADMAGSAVERGGAWWDDFFADQA